MLFSKQDIFDLIDSLIKYGDNVKITLDKIGRIELPNRLESSKRARLFVYYDQMLDNMQNRILFILDIIKIKINRADVLDCVIRGLFESYCRVLYICRSDEKEKYTKIILSDLYTIALLHAPFRNRQEIRPIIKMGYLILNSYDDKYKLPKFTSLVEEIDKSFSGVSLTPLIKQFLKKMRFPGIRQIITKYHDESREPKIRKADLLRFYSRLSEQVHGNPYFEMPEQIIESTEFRLFASILLINYKFLDLFSHIAGMDIDFIIILEKLRAISADFSMLWGSSTRSVL
jgi:hypothetical protein